MIFSQPTTNDGTRDYIQCHHFSRSLVNFGIVAQQEHHLNGKINLSEVESIAWAVLAAWSQSLTIQTWQEWLVSNQIECNEYIPTELDDQVQSAQQVLQSDHHQIYKKCPSIQRREPRFSVDFLHHHHHLEVLLHQEKVQHCQSWPQLAIMDRQHHWHLKIQIQTEEVQVHFQPSTKHQVSVQISPGS